jgi:large subunit ribosomal protein L17
MRHLRDKVTLGRTASQRKALCRNIACSLFTVFGARGYIVTTREKAKFVRRFAERLITLAKEDTVHRRRVVASRLGDERAVRKLFAEIAPAYRERPGGYTRIIKISRRRVGDAAVQVLFGFVPAGAREEKATAAK